MTPYLNLKNNPQLIFYGLAALQALIIVPLTLAGWATGAGWQGVRVADWHAHEMIFGFALAVMGGFFSGKMSARSSLLLAGIWVLGRLSMISSLVLDLGVHWFAGLYPTLFFAIIGWPMLRRAKTLRNGVFGFLLGALGLGSWAFFLVVEFQPSHVVEGVSSSSVLLVVMMAFAMGGRIAAAATSGAHQAIGGRVADPAHITLERNGLLLLCATFLLVQFNETGLWLVVACLSLSVIVLLRLWRWRIWVLRDPSVLFLHLGFFWLAIGFFLLGLSSQISSFAGVDGIHAISVGALGTLTISVMARTVLQKGRKAIILPRSVLIAVGFVNLAAVLRLSAFSFENVVIPLTGSLILWELAWVCFVFFLVLEYRASRKARLNSL